MDIKTGLSSLFILVSFILVLNIPINLTGHVINAEFTSGNIFLSILFLVFGIALLLIKQEGKLEKSLKIETLAQKIKKSGKMLDSPKEIIHVAKESGYYTGRELKEGIPIYDKDGQHITTIPRRHISPGTYRNIINSLAKGESNFRRKNYS